MAALDVLGQPDEWSDGQHYALGQLRAHLHAGHVVEVRVDLAAAPIDNPRTNATALKAALAGQAQLFGDVDGDLHLQLTGEFSHVVTDTVLARRPLDDGPRGCPSSIPLEIGPTRPSTLLGHLYSSNGVAHWAAGHRQLVVLVTWPCGHRIAEQHP